jgi:catechol 2,3-dioxygenase-like lactoylglutathione lyase family enzyme
MIKGLHHAGLSVADLERAIGFYKTAHAFDVISRFQVPDRADLRAMMAVEDSACDVALLRGPTGFLELFQFANPAPPDGPAEVYRAGLRHICLQGVDGDQLYDDFVGAGAKSHARPSGLGTGNLYCYIRDLENNILELEGLPYAASVTSPPWFAHVALVTPDIKRLSAFYSLVTGAPVHSSGHFGPEPKYDVVAGLENIVFDGAWVKAGPLTLEFWQYHQPETEPRPPIDASRHGWSHFALEVDDLDAEYQRLLAAGVQFHGAPMSNGAVRFVYGRDPDGTIFELLQVLAGHEHLSLDQVAGRDLLAEIDRLVAQFYRSRAKGQAS